MKEEDEGGEEEHEGCGEFRGRVHGFGLSSGFARLCFRPLYDVNRARELGSS